LAHLFPTAFLLYSIFSVLTIPLLTPLFFSALGLYSLAVFVDSSIQNKSLNIGFLSVVCVFTMNFGYGFGFIKNYISRVVQGSASGIKL